MPRSSRALLDDAVSRGDWSEIERLFERHAMRVALDEPGFWPEVFRVAPEDWVRAKPRIRHFRAMIQSVGTDTMIVDPSALDEFGSWLATQDRPTARDRLADLLGRLWFLRAGGRFDEARLVADRMDDAIDRAEEFSSFGDVLPPVLISMGTTRILAGRLDDAISTYMSAVRWSSSRPPHPAGEHARNFLAIGYALRGDIRRARASAASVTMIRTAMPGTLHYAFENGTQYLPVLLALAELDRRAAEASLARLSTIESNVFWWLDSAVRARFALFWGDCESAARGIELDLLAHRSLSGPRSLARGTLNGVLADLRFATGDIDGAWSALDDAAGAPAGPWLVATRHRLSGGLRPDRPGSSPRAAHHIVNAVACERSNAIAERDRHIERARRSIELDGDLSAIVEASTMVRDRLAESLEISRPSIRLLGNRRKPETLTARELDILRALRRHATVRAMATELFLSTNTVKTHLRNVYRKLGVSTRAAALAAAESMAADAGLGSDGDTGPDTASAAS